MRGTMYHNHKYTNHTIQFKCTGYRKYLSITSFIQPNDCGCFPFHPTIGSEEFVLITLATPVPSYDITRELCHFSDTFSMSQHPCKIYQMLPQDQACGLPIFFCISRSHVPLCACTLFWCLSFSLESLMCTSFPLCLLLVWLHLYSFCMPFLGWFLTYLVPSDKRKLGSSWYYRTLW